MADKIDRRGQVDFILDKASEGIAIRQAELECAVDTMFAFKKFENFLLSRGYSKVVRGMTNLYVKKGDGQ